MQESEELEDAEDNRDGPPPRAYGYELVDAWGVRGEIGGVSVGDGVPEETGVNRPSLDR